MILRCRFFALRCMWTEVARLRFLEKERRRVLTEVSAIFKKKSSTTSTGGKQASAEDAQSESKLNSDSLEYVAACIEALLETKPVWPGAKLDRGKIAASADQLINDVEVFVDTIFDKGKVDKASSKVISRCSKVLEDLNAVMKAASCPFSAADFAVAPAVKRPLGLLVIVEDVNDLAWGEPVVGE